MMMLSRLTVLALLSWFCHGLVRPNLPSIMRGRLPSRTSQVKMAEIEPTNAASVSAVANLDGSVEFEDQEIDEEALIRRINEEIFAESGVDLDQLINPSKVVNLERDLIYLNKELDQTSDATLISEIQSKISKKREVLDVEKRAVMKGWLKNLFVGQSVLAGAISLVMVYDAFPGVHVPLAIQAMGFWMWWLFIIPSLRARKPSSEEKIALNYAFLGTPVVSLLMPTFTKGNASPSLKTSMF